jgi:hypothetical protein
LTIIAKTAVEPAYGCESGTKRRVAADNQNNNSGSQNSNAPPFTGNDPPASGFKNSPTFPVVFAPVPACSVITADKDDRNGLNGDDKNPGHGNPHCQPASPLAPLASCNFQIAFIDENGSKLIDKVASGSYPESCVQSV